jgi:hypothetical protein
LGATALAVALVASLLGACSGQNSQKPGAHEAQQQTQQRAATPAPEQAPAGAPPANTEARPTGTSSVTTAGLVFDVPNSWAGAPPTNAMRKAQYKIPAPSSGVEDGEMVLFFFGEGQGGDATSNLARWRGQITPEAGAPSDAKENSFTAGALSVKTLDVSGTYASGMPGAGPAEPKPGWRLIGAVVEGPGGPWFFKAVGPKETMAAVENEINALFHSVETGG